MKQKPIHKFVKCGSEYDDFYFACSLGDDWADVKYSDDWNEVTCKRCLWRRSEETGKEVSKLARKMGFVW